MINKEKSIDRSCIPLLVWILAFWMEFLTFFC